MQISAGIESIDKCFVTGELRENPQFNLRIVSDDQSSSFGMAHEATTILDCVRHLLDVRIRASETSRRRSDLTKVCVQPASPRTNELDHVLAIARQSFLHRAVFKQLRDNRILRRQWLQLPIAS